MAFPFNFSLDQDLTVPAPGPAAAAPLLRVPTVGRNDNEKNSSDPRGEHRVPPENASTSGAPVTNHVTPHSLSLLCSPLPGSPVTNCSNGFFKAPSLPPPAVTRTEKGGSKVSGDKDDFSSKMYQLATRPDLRGIISFSSCQKFLVVHDAHSLEDVLKRERVFESHTFDNLKRSLNYHEFRKFRSSNLPQHLSGVPHVWEHEFFQFGRPDLLRHIKTQGKKNGLRQHNSRNFSNSPRTGSSLGEENEALRGVIAAKDLLIAEKDSRIQNLLAELTGLKRKLRSSENNWDSGRFSDEFAKIYASSGNEAALSKNKRARGDPTPLKLLAPTASSNPLGPPGAPPGLDAPCAPDSDIFLDEICNGLMDDSTGKIGDENLSIWSMPPGCLVPGTPLSLSPTSVFDTDASTFPI